MTGRGRERVVRGGLAASVATFVALLSHVSAGGEMPGVLGIAIPLVLSFALCTVLAGRRLGRLRLTLSVLSSQALFHTLFVLGAVSPGGAMRGHVHGPSALPVVLSSTAATHGAHLGDGPMWLAHLVAAFLTTLFLLRGERAARALLRAARACYAAVRRRIARVLPGAPTAPALPRLRSWGSPRTAADRALASTLVRRGPPALASASPLPL